MNSIYQLRIVLKDVKPPIWRRVHVPGDITLAELHRVIQLAMGWLDYHLHEFVLRVAPARILWTDGMRAEFDPWDSPKMMAKIRGERIFMSAEAIAEEPDLPGEDESKVTLPQVCPEVKDKLEYTYDLGDGWRHEVIVQKIFTAKQGVKYPLCTAGRRACPPEDSGGPLCYEDLLVAMVDPSHPEHESLLVWLGGPFDPEHFDPALVNEAFREEWG